MRLPIAYSDQWFQLLGIPLWSVFYRHIGEITPMIQLLRNPQYYLDLAFIAIAAYGLWKLNLLIIKLMDRRYSWASQAKRRLALQASLAYGMTGLLVLLLTFFYHQVVQLQPSRYNLSYVLSTDVMATWLFVSIIHLLYTGMWMVTYHCRVMTALQLKLTNYQQKAVSPVAEEKASIPFHKKNLLVQQGKGFVPIGSEQIAYIFIDREVSVLKTFDGKSLPTDATLEQLSDQLPMQDFFRVSRQLIVNKSAIRKVETDSASRLLLRLWPDHLEETTVSRRRVQEFHQWMSA